MTDLTKFQEAVRELPETHRLMLVGALESYYYVAREEYADGSGEASPQQLAVSELQTACYSPQETKKLAGEVEAMQDAIAQTLSNMGVEGIRFGSGDGFDWDEDGKVKRP